MTVDVLGPLAARPSDGCVGGRRRKAVTATAVAAFAAAVTILLLPPTGIDLAAQVAYGNFWVRHGGAVLDFGWYGGLSPYGYSFLTPPLMAALGGGVTGARVLGVLAAGVASLILVLLLLRTRARRPVLAGLLAVLALFGNIVAGRVTFVVGVMFGLLALLALTSDRPRLRRTGGTGAAVLAAPASPVAGLFVGLAGVRWSSRATSVSLLVAVLVRRRPVRVGALLSATGVLATGIVTTPVGLNAGRLSATFALAVLAGYAQRPSSLRLPPVMTRPGVRPAVLAVLLAGVAAWQHPVPVRELRDAGDPTFSAAYFRPLLDELARRGPVGRVEVVSTPEYWEAAYVPVSVPIARGWLRQADTLRNPVFFDGRLTGDRYGGWLRDNGVSLVALAASPAALVGRREARLVRAGQPYLRKVWRGGAWTLYAVAGAPSVVSGAALVSSSDLGVILQAPSAGDVLVRLRWSRWLAVRGPRACLTPGPDGWTTLRAGVPGRYLVTGSFRPGPRC